MWLLVAPYLIGLSALVIVPAIGTIALSLTEYDMVREPRFVGADNFVELLADDVFRIAVRNSLVFAAIAIPLRLAVVVALSLLLHRRMRGANLHRASVYLPAVVPEVAFALAWLWIFNPVHGPLNGVLGALGLAGVPWLTDPAAAQAAIIIMSLFTIGEAFVVAMYVRRTVPSDYYDLAEIEGAQQFATFRWITLPFMWPVLLLLAVRDLALSLQSTFVPALIVTGGGPPPYATTYIPLFIYREGFEYLRYGYAAAATVVTIVIIVLLGFLQLRVAALWRPARAR